MKVSVPRAIFSAFVARTLVQVLTFVSGILVARLLGAEGKGWFSLAQLWSFVLASVISVGLEVGLIYRISRTPDLLRTYARLSLLYAFAIGGICAAAFFFLSQTLGFLSGASLTFSALTAALIPIQLGSILLSALWVGKGRISFVYRVHAIAGIVNLVLLAWLFLGEEGGAELVLAMYAASSLLHVLILYLVMRGEGLESSGHQALGLRDLFSYSLKAYPGTIAGLLQLSLIALILGMVSTADEAGLYSVAYAVIAALYVFPVIMGSLVLNLVSASGESSAPDLAARAARMSFAVMILLSLCAGVAAQFGIRPIYGSSFSSSSALVWIMLPSAVGFSVSKVLNSFFQGINRPHIASGAALFGVVIVLSAGVPLSSRYGAVGAALAMTLSALGSVMLQLVLFHKVTGVRWGSVLLCTRADLETLLRRLHGAYRRGLQRFSASPND